MDPPASPRRSSAGEIEQVKWLPPALAFVAQWIERRSSEPLMGVRFLSKAHCYGGQAGLNGVGSSPPAMTGTVGQGLPPGAHY